MATVDHFIQAYTVLDTLPPLLLTLGVTITYKKMQEQGDDATTVATALWHGNDPASKVWKQSLMWQHILECFEAGQMTPFPLDIQRVKNLDIKARYKAHLHITSTVNADNDTNPKNVLHAKCVGIPTLLKFGCTCNTPV